MNSCRYQDLEFHKVTSKDEHPLNKDLLNNMKLDLALDLSKFDLDLPDQAHFK